MYRKLFILTFFLLVPALVLTNFAQAELIGYWKNNESSGTIAADSAGGDNDGILFGDQLEWTAGRFGGALSFPGVPDESRVEFPTTGMSATAGTVAMWGLLSDPQPAHTKYFFGHTTQPQWANRVQLYMDEGDNLLDIGLGNSHTRDIDIMELPMEEWLHVALTWDSGNYVVYVNGETVATGTYTGFSDVNEVANIGNDGSSRPYEGFAGLLDDVRLYDHSLNAAEILAAMEGEEFDAAPAALPEGWRSRDIGTIGGSAAEIDGTWTISADGDDIWYKSDEFHYAFMPLSGDGTIVARVVDNGTGSDTWAKGGVMIRETLDQDSKHAMMVVTGGSGDGKAFQHRPITGQLSFSAHGGDQLEPPLWVKLTRVGNTFTGYYSFDGVNWIEQENWSLDEGDVAQNPATIEMARDVYIGLFVTSHESGEIRTYTFDNVSVIKLADVTAPGDLVQGVPNDGDWPIEYYRPETPDLAIDDNIETKYLHFKGDFDPDPGTGGAGLQVTPSAGPTILTGLTFTTANDFPGRDPIAFELSGSNVSIDGPYELIASDYIVDFAQEVEWPRFTKNEMPIRFDNEMAYSHYQIIFTAIRGPVGGSVNSMQIAEVELLGVPALSAPAGANIILVTEEIDRDWDGLRDDHSLESFLISEGHRVDVRPEYWNVLTPEKIAELNAADLIIVSRLAWSSRYNQGNEATEWNSLTTPLLQMNSHFVRNTRWKWVNSEAREPDDTSFIYAEAVDPYHPVFRGLLTAIAPSAPDGPFALDIIEMIDPLVGTGFTAFIGGIDMGNGQLIAKPVGLEAGWIAEWEAGVEFFDGAGQYAGGRRMLFCAGTRVIHYYDDDREQVIPTVSGELNLTAEGLQIFRNAIDYMLGGVEIILVTQEIDWDLDGLRDDHSLESFLVSEGHIVDVRPDYWKVLTPEKIAELNAADLIIISRLAWSDRYDEGNETSDWNSLTTPLLQMNAYFARNTRWKWINSWAGTPDDNAPYIYAEIVDLLHPIFIDMLLSSYDPDGLPDVVQIIDPLVGTGLTSFIGTTDMGNGRLIAKSLELDMGWIAEWDVGVEFFDGAGQYAGGRRMLFCAGTQEIQYYDYDRQEVITTAQGELNLTAEGLQIFRNAIDYLLNSDFTGGIIEPPGIGPIR